MNPDVIYNQLALELKTIEDQIRELKQKQFTGTDTVQTYANQNGGWDLDFTTSFVGPATQQGVDKAVMFTSDSQPAPVNSMRYIILVDNQYYHTVTSFDWHPQPDDVAVLAYVHDTFLSYVGLQPTPGLDAWYFNVTGYRSGMNIKVKFIVDSTDTGTVSIRDLAF